MKELTEQEVFDFRALMKRISWGFTTQLLTEYLNYNIFPFFSRKDGHFIPVSENEIKALEKIDPLIKELDLADRSQIVVGRREGWIILTDDEDLQTECMALKLAVFTLPVFCLLLVQHSLITKKQCYQILHFLEINGWFALKILKRTKKRLQAIR
jgi:hypothetical protein